MQIQNERYSSYDPTSQADETGSIISGETMMTPIKMVQSNAMSALNAIRSSTSSMDLLRFLNFEPVSLAKSRSMESLHSSTNNASSACIDEADEENEADETDDAYETSTQVSSATTSKLLTTTTTNTSRTSNSSKLLRKSAAAARAFSPHRHVSSRASSSSVSSQVGVGVRRLTNNASSTGSRAGKQLIAEIDEVRVNSIVSKKGFINFLEDNSLNWSKKYVVVRRPYLFIYMSEKDPLERAIINLSTAQMVYNEQQVEMLQVSIAD